MNSCEKRQAKALHDYCIALVELVQSVLAGLNEEKQHLLSAAIDGGKATIKVTSNLAPPSIIGELIPLDPKIAPHELFRIDFGGPDATVH